MTTIMCGEIIEWIIKIACFCSSSNSRIPIRNHYSKQIDPNFEKLRALAGKDQYCEKNSSFTNANYAYDVKPWIWQCWLLRS